MIKASAVLVWSFAALGAGVALLFVLGVRRAAGGRAALLAALGAGAWMALTYGLADAGLLRFDTRPPTFMLFVVAVFALGFGVAFSPLGRKLALGLPLAALVGAQAFRLPLEIAMHRAYEEGVMPVQMSYSGLNFDVVTGASAAVVALLLLAGRAPRWLVRLWNWLGTLLLANVLVVAILSTPLPIRMFHDEPANVWVAQAPFVWLPAVMVLAAIVGHVLVFRRLRAESRAAVGAGEPALVARPS